MTAKLVQLMLALLALATLALPPGTARAQGTAFTYQGQLQNNGSPASGIYNLTFSLFNAGVGGSVIAGPVTTNGVLVTNGLFAVQLDFGGSVFNGQTNWLAIGVATKGTGTFTTLSPLQELTPAPYAIYAANAGSAMTAGSAGSVAAGNIVGTLPVTALPNAVLTNDASGVMLAGTFAGNGGGMTNVQFGSLALDWGNYVLASTLGPGGQGNDNGGGASVCAADIYGNGSMGLVSANYNAQTLTVWTNNGNGGFGSSATLTLPAPPLCLLAADVNGDGYVDVMCLNSFSAASTPTHTLSIFTNNGYGVFGSNATLAVSGSQVIAADVLGNGHLDLILAQPSRLGLDLWTNNGAGIFTEYTNLPTDYDGTLEHEGGYPISLCTADVEGNGHVDLVSANTGIGNGNGELEVWTNNGSGFFGYSGSTGVGRYNGDAPGSVIAADVMGNGHVALICADGTNSLTIYTNNGLGSFSHYTTLAVGLRGQQAQAHGGNVIAADVNGDGHVDLISANWGDGTLTVLTNNGAGVFGFHATLPAGGGPDSVIAADVNGDGHVDLAAGNPSGLNILINTPEFNGLFSGTCVGDGSGLTNVTVSGSNVTGSINASQLASIGNTNAAAYDNFFVGPAGNAENSGYDNTAAGYFALFNNTIGFNNTAYGCAALYANTNGADNTAMGAYGLENNTGGTFNTALGVSALLDIQTGNENTAVGGQSLERLGGTYPHYYGGGTNNIALGYQAAYNYTENESSNIDIGNPGVGGENNTIRIGTPGIQTACYLAGTVFANGTFVSSSDRNAKHNIQPVDPQAMLAKVAALPVSRWNYKQSDTSDHIGPMAQDFYAAFSVGPDDRHITTLDESGVALAAIQGLNQKVETGSQEAAARMQTLAVENAELKQQNESLTQRMNELESIVEKLNTQK